MKKILTICVSLLFVLSMGATNLAGKRIYINPGHGSFGPNDRPMATIPYPNLPTTGKPDTCGFYETNTNLWKCLYLRDKLVEAGATVVMSREASGPWPYAKVNGDYPDYSDAAYKELPDYEAYNKNLSVICEEVESGNYDMFLSVHSNAAADGTLTNYPLGLYRGHDTGSSEFETTSRAIMQAIWPYRMDYMVAGIDPYSYYSLTNMNIRGDIDFYGSSTTRTSASSGNQYTGYLGVLKHGTPGGLFEGYFHTYQPARHRALNHDYCHQEGLGYYRGILSYFGADGETTGYIMGTVKDLHEKMTNKLYNYSPKTNDQWVPCNGAVVTLYKGGVQVAQYEVDSLYNGIFVFEGLAPGNDYTLDATCEGYKPLSDEYKAPITVEANKTAYPMIYLESTSYEPPKVVYTDYMEPTLPASVGVAGMYEMQQSFVSNAMPELSGKTVHRALMLSDEAMIVLAFDAEDNGYIYEYNPTTHELVREIPTTGMQGSLRAIGDIAVTADKVLVACNYTENQYDASYVEGGNTGVRGTFRFYKWEDRSAAPVEVFTSQYTCNWFRANVGNSMAVSGTLDDMTVVVTGPTIAASGVLRLAVFGVTDGTLVSTMRSQDPSGNPALTLPNYGWDMQIKPSPLHEGSFMLIGPNLGVTEITFRGDGTAPTYEGTTSFAADGATFFRYAKHVLMAVPSATEIALYDVTAGLDKATLIKTTNTTLSESATATYLLGAGVVNGTDINLYLLQDAALSRFTTSGVTQPVVPHISAYGLNVEYDASKALYTFSYTANSDAMATNIVFYNGEEEVGKVAVDAAQKGVNTAVISGDAIPGDGEALTWAVELTGAAVGNWGRIHSETVGSLGITRGFCSIDNNPESDYFGRIYILDRAGANVAGSGMHAFNPDYTRINTTVLKGGRSIYGSPYRSWVDDQGYIWLSDGSDAYSGVVVVNPADLEGTYEEFFDFDSRDGNGILTKNGVEMASSVLGLSIYGTGSDTKLLLYNEDAGSTLGKFTVLTYNIGTESGTYKHTWAEAPSSRINIAGQAACDGQPLGCSHGLWVAQRRSAGQNNASATALKFYSWDGAEQLSSHTEEYSDIIDGCMSGAIALSDDETELIMIDGSKNLLVFDVEWQGDKPILHLRYEYACGISDIREMHFDYAGNLVTSGTETFTVFTIPTDANVTVVPAKSTLTVQKTEPVVVAVTGVALDKDAVTLQVGEETTLVATVSPADATEASVEWSSSDEAVATVVDGVVTAVSAGEATITVTTVDGGLTAECVVTVEPEEPAVVAVTGVELDKDAVTLQVGEETTLVATVSPADATEASVEWSSSDEAVATVVDGVVTAVSAGEATITVTTVDGGLTAECVVTVELQDAVDNVTIPGLSYSNYTIWNENGIMLMVFSSDGKMVATGTSHIELTTMPAGIYYVRTANSAAMKVVR